MLHDLKVYWLLLKIRMTKRDWFITKDCHKGGIAWCDDMIRYSKYNKFLCPLQAVGEYKTFVKHPERVVITYAADNVKSPYRKALLWATRYPKERTVNVAEQG